MLRLYFLIPDLDTTVTIAHELSDLGLTRRQVHVAGRDWQHLVERGVNNATLRQTSDVLHAAWRGVKYGVPLGIVLGIMAHFGFGAYDLELLLEPLHVAALIIGMGAFGGLFGLWTSTMIGVSVHDVKIDKYEQELHDGAFLMMVDAPHDRESEIYSAIHRHHPDVVIDKITPAEIKHHVGIGA